MRKILVILAFVITATTVHGEELFPVWTSTATSSAYGYGEAVAGVGDLNRDGFADLAIGEPYRDLNAATQQSRLYVFRGSSPSPGPTWNYVYQENQNFFQLGRSIAGADVNGDGYSDLFSGSQFGVVRGYYGSATGPSSTPSWTFTVPSGGSYTEVANAGDVDNDGYDDVVIGSPYCTQGQSREGCAYLFRGSSTGLRSTPAWTFQSDLQNAQLGASVAGVGDVDLDGRDDVVIGAPAAVSVGRIYLFRGTPSGLATTPATVIDGTRTGGLFGYVVAAAGDGNWDGRPDVLVGAPFANNGAGYQQGTATVFAGTPSGLDSTPIWQAEGSAADEKFGLAVAGIGDFDGDDFAEIAVAAPGFGSGAGRVLVYRGGPAGWDAAPAYVANNPWLPHYGFGFAVACAGDVNGDHLPDLAVGDRQNARVYLYSFHSPSTFIVPRKESTAARH